MQNFSYKKTINCSFDEAILKVKESLTLEGFSVISELDLQEKIKDKLGVDFHKYTILGVCNPKFAYAALQAEKEIGLFLPCNIIVYEEDGKITVSAILPTVVMSLMIKKELSAIADLVEPKLRRAIDSLS